MRTKRTRNHASDFSFIHWGVLILLLVLLMGAKECSRASRGDDARTAVVPAQPPGIPSPRVQIYYYCWYGTSQQDKMWVHWDRDNKTNSPESNDLSSDYYPVLGPYSSQDPRVVDQHMKWLEQAGVGVVIVDWWGIGVQFGPWVLEDAIPVILKAAQDHGIKVTFVIDYYDGRTVSSVAQDIRYLTAKYGNYPAFYRTVRPTLHSRTQEPRPVFYIYAGAQFTPKQWSKTIRNLHKDPALQNPLIFTDALAEDLSHLDEITKGNFDGIALYGGYDENILKNQDETFYTRVNEAVTRLNAVFIPTVGPGWECKRACGDTPADGWPRNNGEAYDYTWNVAIAANPEAIVITAFNEWHEGSQIEPAKSFSIPAEANSDGTGPYKYLDYEGHYGLTGEEASMAYIHRTRQWVERFLGMGQ